MATLYERTDVLDSAGVQVLAAAMFAIIEATYVRRTTYESDLDALDARLTALENDDTDTNSES